MSRPAQRERLRRRRPNGPGGCGTWAGWQAHKLEGTPACADCRRAAAEYQSLHRFRSGFLRDLRRCPKCGSVFREHACQSPPEAEEASR